MNDEIRELQRRAGITPTQWWKKLGKKVWAAIETRRVYLVAVWILILVSVYRFLIGVYRLLDKEIK